MKNRETKIIYLTDDEDTENAQNIEKRARANDIKNILFAKIDYPDIIKDFIAINNDKKITFIFDAHGNKNGELFYKDRHLSISQLIEMFDLNGDQEAHFFCCHAGSKNNLKQLRFLSNKMKENCPAIFLHSGSAELLEKISSNRILGMMESKVLTILKLEQDDTIGFVFPETVNILNQNKIYKISPFEMYKYKNIENNFFTNNKINYIGALEHIIFQQEFILSCSLDSIEKTAIEKNITTLEKKFIINKNIDQEAEESISDYLAIGIYLMTSRYISKNINDPNKDYKLDKIINAISKIEYKNSFLLNILCNDIFDKVATHKPNHYAKILDMFKEDYAIISISSTQSAEIFIKNNPSQFYEILSKIQSPFILKNILESTAGELLFKDNEIGFFNLFNDIKDERAKTSFLNGGVAKFLLSTNYEQILNIVDSLKFEKNLVSFLQNPTGSDISNISSQDSLRLLSKIKDRKNLVKICDSEFSKNLIKNNKNDYLDFLEKIDQENCKDFLITKTCKILIGHLFRSEQSNIELDSENRILHLRNFKESEIKKLNIDKKFNLPDSDIRSLGNFLFENIKELSQQAEDKERTGNLTINFNDYQKFQNYIISQNKTIKDRPCNIIKEPQLFRIVYCDSIEL
jgi:hypothetical protein